MSPAVEVTGVGKSFGPVMALDDVNLTVQQDEFVSLLGASGCGKTTLLRIIAGFETPTRGTVRIGGEDVTAMPPHNRPTNIVFQRGALFPHMSVRENIGYSLKLRKWPKTRINEQVDRMLALVRLEGFGDRDPQKLSGGQVQRVALARALACEPRVLLLDEPMSALDLKLRQQMQLELRALQRRIGATFIFVTHDQTEALVMSDRIAIMNGGKVAQLGTPQDIYRKPNSIFVSDFIGQTSLLPCEVLSESGGTATLRIASGAIVQAALPRPLATGTKAVLSVRPESVRLQSVSHADVTRTMLTGNIQDVIYLGPSLRVSVSVSPSLLVWAELREGEAHGLKPGERVALNWAPASAMVIEEGTGP
jgi:spermidine/putrescine transport system ATP-binding protein